MKLPSTAFGHVVMVTSACLDDVVAGYEEKAAVPRRHVSLLRSSGLVVALSWLLFLQAVKGAAL